MVSGKPEIPMVAYVLGSRKHCRSVAISEPGVTIGCLLFRVILATMSARIHLTRISRGPTRHHVPVIRPRRGGANGGPRFS